MIRRRETDVKQGPPITVLRGKGDREVQQNLSGCVNVGTVGIMADTIFEFGSIKLREPEEAKLREPEEFKLRDPLLEEFKLKKPLLTKSTEMNNFGQARYSFVFTNVCDWLLTCVKLHLHFFNFILSAKATVGTNGANWEQHICS